MNMVKAPRIAFVGIAFHDKTRSSAFFKDILKRITPEVDFFSVADTGEADIDDDCLQRLLQGGYDLIVCWQSERLARRLLPFHPNLILIPMWDAARFHPKEYWDVFRTIPIISFSRDLHHRLQERGCISHYVQFFVDPDEAGTLTPRDDLWSRAFFWERRPSEPWGGHLVGEICRSMQIDRLHVHQASDFGEASHLIDYPGTLTTSSWFDQKSDLEDLVRSYGLYFAPRDFEGIGHGFLEAMARGQCVISPNHSTASDYIKNGVDGLLINPGTFPDFGDADYAAIGAAAREYCFEGFGRWNQDIERLVALISARLPSQTPAVPAPGESHTPGAKMPTAPVLSVVITIKNAGKDLDRTLSSLSQQDLNRVEIVISDSHSDDDPMAIINRFADLPIRYGLISDWSIYDGMNKSLAYCSGAYVYYLNAGDVLCDKDVLTDLVAALDQGETDFLIGDHIYIEMPRKIARYKKADRFETTLSRLQQGRLDSTWFNGFPGHQATISRRETLLKTPYDTRYKIAADHDLLLKCAAAGARIKTIKRLIAQYEGGGFSAQNSELCRAEWHQIYHSHSHAPRRIDKFFKRQTGYQLGTANTLTPAVLAGLYNREDPYPDRDIPYAFNWVSAQGLNILLPASDVALALSLHGFSRLSDINQPFIFTLSDSQSGSRSETGSETGQTCSLEIEADEDNRNHFEFRMLLPASETVRFLTVQAPPEQTNYGDVRQRSFGFHKLSHYPVEGPGTPDAPSAFSVSLLGSDATATTLPSAGFVRDGTILETKDGLQLHSQNTTLRFRGLQPGYPLILGFRARVPLTATFSAPGLDSTDQLFGEDHEVMLLPDAPWEPNCEIDLKLTNGTQYGVPGLEWHSLRHAVQGDPGLFAQTNDALAALAHKKRAVTATKGADLTGQVWMSVDPDSGSQLRVTPERDAGFSLSLKNPRNPPRWAALAFALPFAAMPDDRHLGLRLVVSGAGDMRYRACLRYLETETQDFHDSFCPQEMTGTHSKTEQISILAVSPERMQSSSGAEVHLFFEGPFTGALIHEIELVQL